jgi:hypothetical protein
MAAKLEKGQVGGKEPGPGTAADTGGPRGKGSKNVLARVIGAIPENDKVASKNISRDAFEQIQADLAGPAPSPETVAAVKAAAQKEAAQMAAEKARTGFKVVAPNVKPRNNQTGAIDPMLMARVAGGTIGAAGGAAANPEDRLKGALLGGTAGVMAPTAARMAINAFRQNPSAGNAETVAAKAQDALSSFMNMLPDFQRASLLSKPIPLAANAWVGPWGSIVMRGVEDAVQLNDKGFKLLKLALNPKNFAKEWTTAVTSGRAKELIHSASERTEGMMGKGAEKLLGTKAGKAYRTMTEYPGIMMTAGDDAARKLAVLAGYTEDEARAITLTSEPYSAGGRGISKFKKGAITKGGKRSWYVDMALPFYRTNVNQIEQSLDRTPAIGLLWNRYAKDIPETLLGSPQLAKQIVGTGVTGISYMLGTAVPKEDARITVKFLNNFGGQYGALASAAFMMGQASREGKSELGALTQDIIQSLPMPSTQPITDLSNIIRAAKGEKEFKWPAGLTPGILDPEDPLTKVVIGALAPKTEGQPVTGPRTQSAPTSRFKYVPVAK